MKSKSFSSVTRWTKKNLPTILTWISAISTAGALYFTGKATVKAVRKYDEIKAENKDASKKQILKAVIPYYIPAAGFATVSIASTFTSNHVNLKRQRILSGAVLAGNEALQAFKKKVSEKIGDDKVKEIEAEQAKEAQVVKKAVYLTEEVIQVYDTFTQYKFQTTMTKLIDAETEVNRKLANWAWSNGVVHVDEFYRWMGVKSPHEWTALYTWNRENMEVGYETTWVDFYHEEKIEDDGSRLIILRCDIQPEIDQMYVDLDENGKPYAKTNSFVKGKNW